MSLVRFLAPPPPAQAPKPHFKMGPGGGAGRPGAPGRPGPGGKAGRALGARPPGPWRVRAARALGGKGRLGPWGQGRPGPCGSTARQRLGAGERSRAPSGR